MKLPDNIARLVDKTLKNTKEHAKLKDDAINQANELYEITQMRGWARAQNLLLSFVDDMYPNPKDDKYKTWEHLEKDYTYARGATDVVREFLTVMSQQGDVYKNLVEEQRELSEDSK